MNVNGKVPQFKPETPKETTRRLAPLRRASFEFCKRQKALHFSRRDLIAVMATQIGILIRNEFETADQRARILQHVGSSVTHAAMMGIEQK